MAEITISKTEYQKLKFQASAYRKFAENFFEQVIKDPVDQTIEDFKATKLYSAGFINDLEDGLKKSSYGKKYAD